MNRNLTTDDAARGVRPTPLTAAEWAQMWYGSLLAERAAQQRAEQARLALALAFPLAGVAHD